MVSGFSVARENEQLWEVVLQYFVIDLFGSKFQQLKHLITFDLKKLSPDI